MYSLFWRNALRTLVARWVSKTLPWRSQRRTSFASNAFGKRKVFRECSSYTTRLSATSPTRPFSVAAFPMT